MIATLVHLAALLQEGEGPDIIPDPNERHASNYGGLIVGIVLVVGWLVAGFLLFRRARRRP